MFKLRLLGVVAFVAAVSSAFAVTVPPTVFNPLQYGAVGDGHTNNTAAFARVMAAVAAAGGGTVWVPAGRYLTGSIRLVDNVDLHLEPGAELLYSGNPSDSPIVPARFECTNVYSHAPLIYADGCHNVSITGRGTLNGQGWNWWWRSGSKRVPIPAGKDPAPARAAWLKLYARIEAGEKLTAADFTEAARFLRPSLVGLYHCHNVLVDGITLFKSPMWMLQPVYSDDIVVHGVRFISADPDGHPSREGVGPNGDGIDIDSSRNVRISDCFFSTSDDCVVIKSGRDNDGLRTNQPTEYVTVTNCVMYKGHGAVVIGSETSGGIRDVTASNIVSRGTDTGIRIKSQRGRGGILQNFRFSNWVIEDPRKVAFEINMRYGHTAEAPVSIKTPLFRNFNYSNITVVNARKVATIVGLPERAVEGLRFDDINATGDVGVTGDDADDVQFHDVRIATRTGAAFSFTRSSHLGFDDVSARTSDPQAPAMALANDRDVYLHDTRAVRGTGTFLQVSGAATAAIELADNDLAAAAKDVVIAPGVSSAAVTRR